MSTALIESSEVAAVVVVMFIYTRADLEWTPNTNTNQRKEGGKEGLHSKQEQS